jgi:hypothetical protein
MSEKVVELADSFCRIVILGAGGVGRTAHGQDYIERQAG